MCVSSPLPHSNSNSNSNSNWYIYPFTRRYNTTTGDRRNSGCASGSARGVWGIWLSPTDITTACNAAPFNWSSSSSSSSNDALGAIAGPLLFVVLSLCGVSPFLLPVCLLVAVGTFFILWMAIPLMLQAQLYINTHFQRLYIQSAEVVIAFLLLPYSTITQSHRPQRFARCWLVKKY